MRKTFLKILGGMATASLIASLVAPAVFADTTVTISNNGKNSTNKVILKESCISDVSQTNTGNTNITVNETANTGGNKANNNAGTGDVTVNTGDITSTTTLTVNGGSNTATPPDCCNCLSSGDLVVEVSNNNQDSLNKFKSEKSLVMGVNQTNSGNKTLGVTKKLKTGKNKANGNTGEGDKKIDTGKIDSTTEVELTAPSNSTP